MHIPPNFLKFNPFSLKKIPINSIFSHVTSHHFRAKRKEKGDEKMKNRGQENGNNRFLRWEMCRFTGMLGVMRKSTNLTIFLVIFE